MTQGSLFCAFCGEPRELDLLEVFLEERAWIFSTCCEEYHETILADLEYAAELAPVQRIKYLAPLRDLFAGYGISLRSAFLSQEELGSYRLDYGLHLEEISLVDAKAFIATHHRHNKPPVSWRWGHAIYNGDTLVAVAMVGRPTARMIDATRNVEVTRLCVDPSLDPGLVFNASSMLYAAADQEAKRRGFARAITYTLETEQGSSLKAAGWILEHTTRAESWHRASRPRAQVAPAGRKHRWRSARSATA